MNAVQSRMTERTHEVAPAKPLDALYDIAQLLAARTGQKQLVTDILAVLEEQLGMRRAIVMLLSPDGMELVVEATHGEREEARADVRYRPGEGVTGRVLQTGTAVVVPRVSDAQEFRDSVFRRLQSTSHELSFICVPITLGSEVIGTLSADVHYQDAEALSASERVLSVVAAMIAHDARARRTNQMQNEAFRAENLRLRQALGESFRPEKMTGNSHQMRDVYTRIHQVAASDTTVMIRGESGTGKELVAAAIHYQSSRPDKRLVKVNCAALNDELLLSELFGHERGAFTGAFQTRIGRIEEAAGGTLFLDEIGDFSASTQVKLLRVLQEREFQRVGSNTTRHADVRVVCATNRDLEEAVSAGHFRQDLYYRINVFPIVLPPLRDRRDDILLLADRFISRYAKAMGKDVLRISTPAINMLFSYHWPGNVRELENCIEHAVLLTADGVIREQHLPPTLQIPDATGAPPLSLSARTQALEREMILDALKRTDGNASAAARELGITARMVRYKAKKLGVDASLRRTD